MTKDQRERYNNQLSRLHPASVKIAKRLKNGGYLQTPSRKRGWGMSEYLVLDVAECIDKEFSDLFY